MRATMIGIDLAKESFQLYGLNDSGDCVIDKKLKRSKLLEFFIHYPTCQIFMEACGGANYWSRKLGSLGHKVSLISPQHVKPFVGHQKNDRNDARAIIEAGRRPEAKFVATKQLWQQDLQSLHRIRERVVCNKTALTNQMHGLLLEYGLVIPKNIANIDRYVPCFLEDGQSELTPMMRELLNELYEEYKKIKQRLKTLTDKINTMAKQNPDCKSLEQIGGVGPIISTAFLAGVGDVHVFKNGRQLSAWLGLVPKQYSTGGKTKLGGITKNGDSYLRKLVIQGARAQVTASTRRQHKDEYDQWIQRLVEHKGFNKAAVAVANKNVRRMWATLAS